MARALVVLVPALAALVLAPARASSFTCEQAEEVYEEALGETGGRPVFLRVCTSPSGEHAHRALVLINWQAADGDQDVWQTLVDGPAEAPAGAWTPTLADGLLTLRRPSGGPMDPLDQYTIETWTWKDGARRFDDHTKITTSPWAEGKAALDAALEAGDLGRARELVGKLGTTPNGGITWLDDEIYLQFLAVAGDQALRRHRLFDTEGAAAIAYEILANPPLSSPESSPRTGQLVICRELAPTCTGKGSFNDLPASVEVANQLSALAFFLARGDQPEAALSLLDPLLATFPRSGALERTRGDALWALGREDEARASWRRAAELGVALDRRTRRRMGD